MRHSDATTSAAAAAPRATGDVVVGVDGVADWISERRFQSWWRLTREPVKAARLDVPNGGVRQTVELPIHP